MASERKAAPSAMKIFRALCWLAFVILSACQSDPFIPVTTPTHLEQALVSTTHDTLTPRIMDPTASPKIGEPATPTPVVQQTPVPDASEINPCLQATFIADVSIPDGTRLMPEEIILKIWRIKNSGTCAWPDDLRLVFTAGEPMGGRLDIPARYYPEGVPLIASLGERAWAEARLALVPAGETIDLPVFFQAPGTPGAYLGLWSLQSSSTNEDLIQIYLDLRVEGTETPEPTTWGGEWTQLNLHSDRGQTQVYLEQRGLQVRGYFYSRDGEPYLLEGGLFDQGSRLEGTFGPLYHDGYPFTWRLMADNRRFQGVYRDQIVSAGAWCGTRPDGNLPDPCALEP